jgi:hypothetical protein
LINVNTCAALPQDAGKRTSTTTYVPTRTIELPPGTGENSQVVSRTQRGGTWNQPPPTSSRSGSWGWVREKDSFLAAGKGSRNARLLSVASAWTGHSDQTLPGKGKNQGGDDYCSRMPCSRARREMVHG